MPEINDETQRAYWEQDHGHRGFDHPIVKFFATQRVEFVSRMLDLRSIRNALDVGCGNGFSTYYMQPYVNDIWAVDRSEFMLARHPLFATGKTRVGDVSSLPFEDASFDLVYVWEVLHHVSDPVVAVREMARVSRRYVLAAEPNPFNPAQFGFALYDREHRWVLRYSRRYMRRVFEAAGLRVVHQATGGFTFPNMTPMFMLPILKLLPYRFFLGISNWILAEKPRSAGAS